MKQYSLQLSEVATAAVDGSGYESLGGPQALRIVPDSIWNALSIHPRLRPADLSGSISRTLSVGSS